MSVRTGSCGPILVVDEDEPLCALLRHVLGREADDVLCVGSGEAALQAVELERPALAILEVRLPGICGYEVCRALRERFGPGLPIVFVSGDRTQTYDRVAGMLLGADDYLAKPFAPEELLLRVRALLRRETRGESGLTPREYEVLSLLAAGRRPEQIATALVISPKTVRTHIERILGKLEVHSRTEAVALAYRQRLVSVPA